MGQSSLQFDKLEEEEPRSQSPIFGWGPRPDHAIRVNYLVAFDEVRPETVRPANLNRRAVANELRSAAGHGARITVALGVGHCRPGDQCLTVWGKVFAVRRQLLPFIVVAASLWAELVAACDPLGCTADYIVRITLPAWCIWHQDGFSRGDFSRSWPSFCVLGKGRRG